MRAFVAVCALAGLAAADTDKQRADKLFDEGRRQLAAKEYALACTAFEQSQKADPAIGTQLNIALCYEEWGHVASAYRAYLEAERLAKLKFDDRAKHARKKLDELTPKVPHLRFDIPDDADVSAVFLFDGKALDRAALADDLLVDPGPHSIEARVPGQPPKTTGADLAIGEHKRLAIDVAKVALPPPAPAPRKTGRLYGGIALVAGGGITMGVAGLLAIGARNDYNAAVAYCPNLSCDTHDAYQKTQDAISRANAMTYVTIGGVALAAVGVYLILTSHGDRAEHAVAAAPLVGPGLAGVAIGGRL